MIFEQPSIRSRNLSQSSVNAGVISNTVIYPSSVIKACTLYPLEVCFFLGRTIFIINGSVAKNFAVLSTT